MVLRAGSEIRFAQLEARFVMRDVESAGVCACVSRALCVASQQPAARTRAHQQNRRTLLLRPTCCAQARSGATTATRATLPASARLLVLALALALAAPRRAMEAAVLARAWCVRATCW
jgi:hypothetical protein